MDKRKLIQVDFHPDGRVVYIYDDGKARTDTKLNHGMTPAEALQKRLEEYKKSKRKTSEMSMKETSDMIMHEYGDALDKLGKM